MIMNRLLLLLFPAVVLFVVVLAGTNEEGLQYLKENKEKEGVIELPSGLQYKVLKKGNGPFHPGPSTPCLCHYAGTLIDGSTFDSSYDRGSPTTFAPNQVIKGWTEAMQLMTAGDKWELYIPSELGYGDSGSGAKIPGGSVLVFQMEILELQGDESMWVPAITCDPADIDGSNCSDEEKKYITKTTEWDKSKISKEIERLNKLVTKESKTKNVKADLMNWMRRRLNILTKLGGENNTGGEEEKEL